MNAPGRWLECGGPCRWCGRPIIRRVATRIQPRSPWLHTDSQAACHDDLWQALPTAAEPAPEQALNEAQVRANRLYGRSVGNLGPDRLRAGGRLVRR